MDSAQTSFDETRKRPREVQEKIDAGMARADENADHFWKRVIDGCILACARRLREFTVDDVLDEIEKIPNAPSTHNLAALGPAMVRAQHDHIISRTDRVQRSRRGKKHGNRHNVWRSEYYAGESK